MKSKELVEIYLNSMGRTGGNSVLPIMPWVVMDKVLHIYTSQIMLMDCKFDLAKYKHAWLRDYTKFNRRLFNLFDDKATDAMIELMDRVEEWMSGCVSEMRKSLQNLFLSYCGEKSPVVADCMLADIITQSANIMWSYVHKNSFGEGVLNPLITAVQKDIIRFVNVYFKSDYVINCNDSEIVTGAVRKYCDKLVDVMKMEDKRNGEN